jgi:hypothetical protein
MYHIMIGQPRRWRALYVKGDLRYECLVSCGMFEIEYSNILPMT